MLTLKAPKITPTQRKELEAHKRNLQEVVRDLQNDSQKVAELREKEKSLEEEAESLKRDAAAFNREAEIKLAATLKQIERVHEAIREAESVARDDKEANFQIIDQAQELISKLCLATYDALLDQIGSALAPYYTRFNDARQVARNAPAVNDLAHRLRHHGLVGYESVERFFDAAKDTLRKIDALLTGGEIYRYKGCENSEESKAAA